MRASYDSLMPRSALIVVLLTLIVLVTAALTWEALASARRARAIAEGVLHDYATVTAVQFVREAEARIDTTLGPALDGARHALLGHAPGPRPSAEACQCPAPPSPHVFRITGAGVTVASGVPIDPAVVADLRADLADAGTVHRTRPQLRVHPDHGLVVSQVEGRPGDRAVIGFLAPFAYLNEAFGRVLADVPLLPGTLAGVVSNRSIGIRVGDGRGAALFTAGPSSSPFTGAAALPPRLGGLRVDAAIPPELAPSLVIGGLPASRWPFAAGLLLLSVGLVTAAALQLRREIRFTRERADFVSSVSHELRTPLAQIRLFGETLVLGRVRSREEEQRAAAVIVQEARRLSQMVDNILLFSRAGRESLPIRRVPVDPDALATEVVDAFRPQAASKQMSVELSVDRPVPPMTIDPDAARQVLLNLLDNAAKYGPRGQTIRVGVGAREGGLVMSVEDEGPGVAPADRPRIWEPFWRGSGSAEGGSGLGLAIVRELVTRHGGRASVEPGARAGAKFTVLLDATA